MANNPKKMFDEERRATLLTWKERRNAVMQNPLFLSYLKETATFGDWTDYEMLWSHLQTIFNSSFDSKYSRDLLLTIEDKIIQARIEWQTKVNS